ncbi:hypothetical protein MYAM1_001252 [Malassezia yamatoensis]|uniref:Uncharacterized protein n=1 Tax=Malassezia yamatoensis TaxID=253288 RepID=A0AAJ5YQB5_9BASI|nr:hypothetical protein MYAM1_001252 [Malassezia yamatoensis]
MFLLYVHNLTKAGAKALAVGSSTKKAGTDSSVPRRSLTTIAKLEHARRRLMSSFVRGEIVGDSSLLESKKDKAPSEKAVKPHKVGLTKDTVHCMDSKSQTKESVVEPEVKSDINASGKKEKRKNRMKEKNQVNADDRIPKKDKEKKHSDRPRKEKSRNADPATNKSDVHHGESTESATRKRKRNGDKHTEMQHDISSKVKTERGDVADAKLKKKLRKERKKAKREAR